MPNHESSSTGKRLLAYAGTPIAVAGIALGVGQLRGGEDSPKTVGQVPSVESCTSQAETPIMDTVENIRAAVAHQACGAAVSIAGDVVRGRSPEGMYVSEHTEGPSTTFGAPTYTFAQTSVSAENPLSKQTYSVSFLTNEQGQGDLSKIIRMTGDNGNDAAVIDHYTEGAEDVYVAGFIDPLEGDVPVHYDTSTEAGVRRAQDAGNTALIAFRPQSE